MSQSPSTDSDRVHYAWYVLAASVVIELFGLGFGIFAITTVYPYIVDAFPNWPRTTVFAPTTVIISVVGCMSPFIGSAVDRYPIRLLFLIGILLQSLALYLFASVETPTAYLGVSALLGLGMSTVTILPNQVLVSRWFHHRVGLANGIVLAATALGASLAPPLVTRLIEALDWRTAFQWMSLLALLPPMLVTLLVIRDRPQDLGLEPYGSVVVDKSPKHPAERHLTLSQAIRTATFWLLAGAVFFGGMPCYSYNKHILIHLKELGYAPVQAADIKGLFFLISACSRVSFGWLCDRFDPRRTSLVHFLCIAFAYPFLLLVPTHRELLIPCLVVVAIGYGGLLPSMPILAVYYFGRTHLGKILGAYKVAYDIAAASAPLFTAQLYDMYKGYAAADAWNSVFAWVGVGFVAFGLCTRRSLIEPELKATAIVSP